MGLSSDMEVRWFQYSRKNFLFPEKQLHPHTSFDQEVKYCHEMFSDGQPHILGPMNADHWVVFIADRTAEGLDGLHVDQEQNINIYMYGIDQEIAQQFVKAEPLIIPSMFTSLEEIKDDNANSNNNTIKLVDAAPCFVTTAAEATRVSGISK